MKKNIIIECEDCGEDVLCEGCHEDRKENAEEEVGA